MSDKTFYFISGLPRSGSTLLSVLLQQNPVFHTDIVSPLRDIIKSIIYSFSACQTHMSIDEQHRIQTCKSVMHGFYEHVNKPIIFDTQRMWSADTDILEKLLPDVKIVCCVRDIVPILNSFENQYHKSKFLAKVEYDSSYDFQAKRVENYFESVKLPVLSLYEGIMKNPSYFHLVHYDDLVSKPRETLESIYKFLDQPFYDHDLENFHYENKIFDQFINFKDLHTVNGPIKQMPPKKLIPDFITNSYKDMNLEFWRHL